MGILIAVLVTGGTLALTGIWHNTNRSAIALERIAQSRPGGKVLIARRGEADLPAGGFPEAEADPAPNPQAAPRTETRARAATPVSRPDTDDKHAPEPAQRRGFAQTMQLGQPRRAAAPDNLPVLATETLPAERQGSAPASPAPRRVGPAI
ncbi:MAG: hypothetical protein Q4F71_12450 [Paracoccus sp. (in: a-proteobacteria)]|nr:hypothetical protein [Paracoccus sp. (in: a-proteobacteria)]